MCNTRISFIIFLISGLLLSGCISKSEKPKMRPAESEWRYFGQAFPNEFPQIFSPDIISTRRNERDISMSPAGNEIFYTYVSPDKNLSIIIYLFHDGAFWSQPKAASFSGEYRDLEPAFSPDGKKLFFASKRPLTEVDSTADWNIWFVERSAAGWSVPKAVSPLINTEGDEFYPSVAKNGTLYFTAKRDTTFGFEDIYYAVFENGEYLPPVNLGENINSPLYEFNAYVAPDESYLLFSSFGRDDGQGGGDLYISRKDNMGNWMLAENLGPNINSAQLDYCPFISYDGKYLFFTSQKTHPTLLTNAKKTLDQVLNLADGIENGLGNIYWVEFEKQVLKK